MPHQTTFSHAEFAALKTPSGKPANLTIAQIMTHTSGLGEAPREAAANVRTLSDLIPLFLAAPMQFEPGAKWSYCQSGINTGSRIVEVVSGMPFDVFVQQRIFDPLGMKNTTLYPAKKPSARLVGTTRKNKTTGALESAPPPSYGTEGHPPLGNGGLFSTGPDYARFCQMLLAGGVQDGKRYLSPEAMKLLQTVQTGDLPTGFFQSAEFGNRGTNYGWGIGTCILRAPHPGVAAMLSPGTFGHGGAWGHAGVDRSRAWRRLRPDDSALGHRQQRRQRYPPRVPTSRERCAAEVTSREVLECGDSSPLCSP